LTALAGAVFAADNGLAVTRRFGVFIGSNSGGRDRIMLRYAVSDAKTVSRIFSDMGGIAGEDNVLLIEPSVADINRQFDRLNAMIQSSAEGRRRTELVFYYSGHSDEDGILLGRERYGYRELRERITAIGTDMRIVILDSCSSGAITRAKGGVKTRPFLFDSSVSAEGYAFLTSSSADEASQESDSIESSYFTHSLVTGLRGAADSVGDGRVTLNELYRFAYTETLAKTETSFYGAQHPSYDIQISGSGDVVLTDVKETSAALLIGEDVIGRLSIRDGSDFLVAELTKVSARPMELGLEPGLYRITLQRGDGFYSADLQLIENSRVSLTFADFRRIAAAAEARSRGTDVSGEEDEPVNAFNIQLIPGMDMMGHSDEKATNHVLLGPFVAMGHNLKGIGVAGIGLINSGWIQGVQGAGIFNLADGYVLGAQGAGVFNLANDFVQGVQGAGIFNLADGFVQGAQGAGVFNLADDFVQGVQGAGIFNVANGIVQGVQGAGVFNVADDFMQGVQGAGIFNYARSGLAGVQMAGIFNYAGGSSRGVQAGLVNIAKDGSGVQAGLVNISGGETMVTLGLVNIVKGGILHPAVFYDDMEFLNASFRSGSKRVYSVFTAGVQGKALPESYDGDTLLAFRAGLGVEFPIGKFFMDVDITCGSIVNFDALADLGGTDIREWKHRRAGGPLSDLVQLRFTAGYKIFEHLGIFGGISYDYIHRRESASPDPETFSPFIAGWSDGWNTHKLGFFGGVQF
jgi:hypothetical protein